MPNLRCLKCKQAVFRKVTGYSCTVCRTTYPVRGGIPILTIGNTNYYGELPEAAMGELVKKIKSQNWKKVLHNTFAVQQPWLYQIITESNRADFRFLLPLRRSSTILDVGAGWGQTTIPLARDGYTVTALDGTWQRLRFIQAVAEQEKIDDHIASICANALVTPFEDCEFDFIFMIGTLEWIPTSVNAGDPRDLQGQALQEMNRILKPGGILTIGIENSHAIKYFLGAPDDHTGISHISYVDRARANQIMKKKYNRDYRTYTYTKDGYTDLLQEAHFPKQNLEFYYPIPDYKTAKFILPLEKNILHYFHRTMSPEYLYDPREKEVRNRELQAIAEGTVDNSAASYLIFAQK